MKRSAVIFISILTLVLSACASTTTPPPPSPTQTAETPAQHYLVLGDISDDPAEVIDGAQPLADYLASQLTDLGYTGGQVRVVSSTEEMIDLLKSGDVDLYFDSTYPATRISDATGGQIILRRWRFGVEAYQSVIFASKASGITRLEDLPGHLLAMDAPYSTSGFMLPAVLLTESGLPLVGKTDASAPIAADEIGFVFCYDDENVLQWVLSGQAAAGVTDDYNFDKAFPPEATEKLVELARTEYTPRQVVVARPGLEPQALEAITQALVSMDENETGRAALEKFQTTQFDAFPEGIEAATQRMREMMELVKDIPLP